MTLHYVRCPHCGRQTELGALVAGPGKDGEPRPPYVPLEDRVIERLDRIEAVLARLVARVEEWTGADLEPL